MQFGQNLNIKQSQNLTMNPQLQQAIKLLQMTNLELHEFLETQFQNNPLLDIIGSADIPHDKRKNSEQEISPEVITKDVENICSNSFSDCNTDMPSSEAYSDFSHIGSYKSLNNNNDYSDDKSQFNFSLDIDLRQHLSNQLYMINVPQDILLIASFLIGNLSDTGYLHETCEEIAGYLMQPVKKVEKALAVCQQLEPAGVFARNLAECIKLQLIDKKLYNRYYEILLDNLDVLAGNHYNKLLKKMKVSKSVLSDMITQIKRLYPKPGYQYSSEPISSIIPDVFIQQLGTGDWKVMLNHATMPKAILNQTYSLYLKKNAQTNKLEKKTKQYLKESYNQASWIIKSLEQRSDTILRVATEILRQQDGFFTYGFEHLKPMNLKYVAEELELHESTISRVTSGKYLRCPRGVFEMKFFFMSGINGKDGEASVASESVKYDIKKIIDAEDPNKILSDGDIAEILKQAKGIDIARRTVAKYREAINIPSSVTRRAQKKQFDM